MSTITGRNFAELNFDEIIKDSTFKGKTIIYDINDVVQDITSFTFDMTWRQNNAKGKIVKECALGTGITIVDGAAGKFQIDSFLVTFNAGLYYYDFKITDGSSIPDKRFYGTLLVKETAT